MRRLNFLSDCVTDISPVRALTGPDSLDWGGRAPRKGLLSDRTPRGLRLRGGGWADTQVSAPELAPRHAAEFLHSHRTRVDSLSPVVG